MLKPLIRKLLDSLAYYVRGIFKRVHDDELALIASGIAFNGILCSLPLFLLFTSLLGVLLRNSTLALQHIGEVVDAVFPGELSALKIKDMLKQVVGDIIAYRTSFGLFGAVVLVWTGTSLFSAIRSALRHVYRIKFSKNLVVSVLEDIAWVFVAGALFIALNFVTWIYSLAQLLIRALPGLSNIDLGIFGATIPVVASFAVTLLMFFIVYRFIPDVRPPSIIAWISALTSAVQWTVAARLFGWYLSESHSFSKLYGTYAFFLVLLVWIYYSSFVFVVGGIVGQLFREKHKLPHGSPGTASTLTKTNQ